MTDGSHHAAPAYGVTLDRAGQALAAGGIAIGVIAAALLGAGGVESVASLLTASFVAVFLGIVAIVAVGGPVWTALHVTGNRSPLSAASAGFGVTLLLSLFATAMMPDAPAGSPWLRLARAIGGTLGLAGLGAGVALLMWRIAYRRVETLSRP